MAEQNWIDYFEIIEAEKGAKGEACPIWYGVYRVVEENGVRREPAFRISSLARKLDEHFILETSRGLIGIEHDFESADRRAYDIIQDEAKAAALGKKVIDKTHHGTMKGAGG